MMNKKSGIWYSIINYKFNSIFIRSFLMVVLLTVIPVAGVGKIIYDNSNKVAKNEIVQMNKNSIYRISEQMDDIFNGLSRLTTLLSHHTRIQMFMMENAGGISTGDVNELNDIIVMFAYTQKYIDSIYIYSDINKFIISNKIKSSIELIDDTSWFSQYSAAMDNSIIISHGKESGIYPYFITIIKPVFIDKYNKIGTIVVNVDIEELGKMIQNPKDNDIYNIYIVDDNDTVIYNKKRDVLFQNISQIDVLSEISRKNDTSDIMEINNEKYVVSTVESELNGWQYVSYIPIKAFDEKFAGIIKNIAKLIIIFIILALLISFAISERTYNPIKRIINVVESIDKETEDSLDNFEEMVRTNEFKFIAGNIIKTAESSRNMKSELERRMSLLNEAQSAALQAQINPHFFYNTLEAIKWMAVDLTGAKNCVSAALGTLSNLFRISLNTNERIVPLAVEIEHTKLYLQIVEMRYAGKIAVNWDIPENLLQYKVLKIFMQPLIENAFEHGIKPKRVHGCIYISARSDERCICIEIKDNGIGMEDDIINQLNLAMKESVIVAAEHIGIRNVNQRIKLLFGNEYGISIESRLDEGSSVVVRFPMVK